MIPLLKRHLSTIYMKLVLAFLFVFSPIFILGLTINFLGENTLKKEILHSTKSQIEFQMESFQNEIQRIIQLKKEYITNDIFEQLHEQADHMSDLELLNIKNRLKILKSASPFIEDVTITLLSKGKRISASQYNNKFKEAEVQEGERMTDLPLLTWMDQLMLREIKHIGSERYLFEIDLSNTRFKKSLLEMVKTFRGGAVLMDLNSQWHLANLKDEPYVPYLNQFSQSSIDPQGQSRLNMRGTTYMVSYEKSKLMNAVLYVFVPEKEVLGPISQNRVWYWILSVVSFVFIIFFTYRIYRLIHRPISSLVRAFQKVEKGDLNLSIHYNNQDEFRYLYNQFNQMVERLKKLIDEVYVQKIRSQRSELKQLQSQINPHFLYNSFFILHGLVRMEDNENASRLIQHLRDYFQFIARDGPDEVELISELKHAKAYIDIQSVRFSDEIQVLWNVMPEQLQQCAHVLVPRLTIQPIIENAYKYALEDQDSGGKLIVELISELNKIRISIEDNGKQLEEVTIRRLQSLLQSEQDFSTTGILNVHRRLRLKFGDSYGLRVSRSSLGGLKVELLLPLAKEEEADVSIADR